MLLPLEWNQIHTKLLSQRYQTSLFQHEQNNIYHILNINIVTQEALKGYELVFDAVYTPKNTRLLKEAAEVGAIVVTGVEMFLRQAHGQFKLFTGGLGTNSPHKIITKKIF